MKHFASIPLVAAMLFINGCALFQPGGISQDELVLWAADAQDAAEVGTRFALLENPEYRAQLVVARDSLNALAQIPPGDIRLTTVLDILGKLPIDELKSERAQLAILGGKIILRRVDRSVELGQIDNLLPIVVALRDGITAGLAE